MPEDRQTPFCHPMALNDAMRALVMAAVAAAMPLSAAAAAGSEQGASVHDVAVVTCETLADLRPDDTLADLARFRGSLFGKPALAWSNRDFAALSKTIAACRSSDQTRRWEWWEAWGVGIDKVGEFTLPILETAQGHARWARDQQPDRIIFPACLDLLEWEYDAVTMTSTSGALFGFDFQDMSIRDTQLAMDFAASCQTHMPWIAEGRFGIERATAEAVIASLIDIAFATATARAEAMTTPTRPSDVQAAIGERPALLGLAGKRIESYVALVNDALALGSLSNDQIEIFNREAEALLAEDQNSHGIAYIEAVKLALRREMFGN